MIHLFHPFEISPLFFSCKLYQSFSNVQKSVFFRVYIAYISLIYYLQQIEGLSSLTLTWLYITSMHDRHDSNGSSVYTPDFAYCGLKLAVSLDRDLRGYLPDIQIKVCFFMERVNFLYLKSTLGQKMVVCITARFLSSPNEIRALHVL